MWVWWHIYNPSTGKEEAEDPGNKLVIQASNHGELMFRGEVKSQRMLEREMEEEP